MNIESKATNLENIEITMTISMTIAEWRNLTTQFNCDAAEPARNLRTNIKSLIKQAESTFLTDPEDPM